MGYSDVDNQRPPTTEGGSLELAFKDAVDGTANFTSDILHSVYGREYLFVSSSLCSGSISTKPNSSFDRVLQKIPIFSSFAELNFQNTGVHQEPVNVVSNNFSSIDLALVDEFNNIIEMNGSEWSCTIMVYYTE